MPCVFVVTPAQVEASLRGRGKGRGGLGCPKDRTKGLCQVWEIRSGFLCSGLKKAGTEGDSPALYSVLKQCLVEYGSYKVPGQLAKGAV